MLTATSPSLTHSTPFQKSWLRDEGLVFMSSRRVTLRKAVGHRRFKSLANCPSALWKYGPACRVPSRLSAPYLPSSDLRGSEVYTDVRSLEIHDQNQSQAFRSHHTNPHIHPHNPHPFHFGTVHSKYRCKSNPHRVVHHGLFMLHWTQQVPYKFMQHIWMYSGMGKITVSYSKSLIFKPLQINWKSTTTEKPVKWYDYQFTMAFYKNKCFFLLYYSIAYETKTLAYQVTNWKLKSIVHKSNSIYCYSTSNNGQCHTDLQKYINI